MTNIPKIKLGIVAVSRDCFPESLSVNRRKALVEAYKAKYDAEDIYECPICIVESEIHMVQALLCCCNEHLRTFEVLSKQGLRNLRTKVTKVYAKCVTSSCLDIL